MTTPILSIITPLYNREILIADCIRSVGLAGLPVEMIIVDDGSKDASVAAVHRTIEALGLQGQVTLLQQANAGPSAARNRAAALARGEWLVFLDSDDLWFPWTLPSLLSSLPKLPAQVKLAFAKGVNFADAAELESAEPSDVTTSHHDCFVEAVKRNPTSRYGACNAAVRRSAFVALGGFSPALRCAEDTDLFLRVDGAVALLLQPVLVGLRRSGHESLTGNVPEVLKGFEWMVRRNAEGAYVGAAHDRHSFLAGSCAYSIRTAFGSGHLLDAYRLYLSNLSLLASPRTIGHLLRLPLTPLMHYWRPENYPFRWSA
jgi:glycosyltransferase involved in cell wall biosynthesis